MIGNNIAGTLSQIGIRAVQPATVIDNGKDMGKAIQDSLKMYNDYSKKQAYIDALQGGDQEKIDSALASYNPEAYAQVMQAREQRANQLADADTQFARQKELANIQFNNNMALKRLEAALKPATAAQQNMQYLQQMGYSPEEAAQLYYSGQNPNATLPLLGEKGFNEYDKAMGKDLAEQKIAEKQMQSLTPRAEQAIARAEESLDDGTGLGQIGGLGWTTGQGGRNRANIKNAQAQINTAMRGLLKQMGVGSTELNSAVEAEAYRYQLNPNMPIEQQKQILDNFKADYMSGNLQKELQQNYGKPSLKQTSIKLKYGLE